MERDNWHDFYRKNDMYYTQVGSWKWDDANYIDMMDELEKDKELKKIFFERLNIRKAWAIQKCKWEKDFATRKDELAALWGNLPDNFFQREILCFLPQIRIIPPYELLKEVNKEDFKKGYITLWNKPLYLPEVMAQIDILFRFYCKNYKGDKLELDVVINLDNTHLPPSYDIPNEALQRQFPHIMIQFRGWDIFKRWPRFHFYLRPEGLFQLEDSCTKYYRAMKLNFEREVFWHRVGDPVRRRHGNNHMLSSYDMILDFVQALRVELLHYQIYDQKFVKWMHLTEFVEYN